MKEILNYLKSEWAVVSGAPFTILMLTVLIFGVVYWIFKERLSSVKDLVSMKEQKIKDYEKKTGASSPDEAKARMDALEARVDALSPRTMSATQRQSMMPLLDGYSGSIIDISAEAGVNEATLLSRSLSSVFVNAGWEVINPMIMGVGNPPMSGIGLLVADASNLSDKEQSVAEALTQAGLEFDLQSGSRGRSGIMGVDVRLLLTHRFPYEA